MVQRFFGMVSFVSIFSVILFSGCSAMRNPYSVISKQNQEIARLKEELNAQANELNAAQRNLQNRLENQLKSGKVKIDNLKKGLVLTLLDDVLFDSGKTEINEAGKVTLQEIAEVLKSDCLDKNISIEGHTDNEPIKHSGWRSNWELSSARANSVVHFFINECEIKPERLNAAGFGEYRPVTDNDTDEARSQNRRVEIVILPEKIVRLQRER